MWASCLLFVTLKAFQCPVSTVLADTQMCTNDPLDIAYSQTIYSTYGKPKLDTVC